MTKQNTLNFQNSQNLFSDITKYAAADLKKVNNIIINSSKNQSDLIGEITKHLVLSKSKRIRPTLTIITAKMCGYSSGNRHHNLAAAIELVHNATLLHDDVVDGSNLRRGKKTANSIWDNKASILVGDYLLSAAFQLMVKYGSLETLDILSNTSGIMANGEILQLSNSNNIKITEDEYLEIIYSKTAILFSCATQIGAIIGKDNANKKIYQNSLDNFGHNLGMAFQITDDIIDYSSDTKTLGKEVGNDFFEGKVTLPIIIAYQKATGLEKARIKEIFADNLIYTEKNRSSFLEIMTLIKQYDALEITTNKALKYKEKAKKYLDIFTESKEKDILLSILEYSVNRQY